MTLDDLLEINTLIARARRHLRDFDANGHPEDYWLYDELYKELKEVWNVILPPFKGYHPTTPVFPAPKSIA